MTPFTVPASPPVFTEEVAPPRNGSCQKLGGQNQFLSFLYPSYHYALGPITWIFLLLSISTVSTIISPLNKSNTCIIGLSYLHLSHEQSEESLDTRMKACHFLFKTSWWLSVAHKRKSIFLITTCRAVWPASYLSSNFTPYSATLISMLQLHWLLLCVSGIRQSLSEFGTCHAFCLEQASLTSSQGSHLSLHRTSNVIFT